MAEEKPNYETATKIKAICKRFSDLKSEKSNYESTWQQVADYILPRKNNVIKKDAPGTRKYKGLYDTTAEQALLLLSSSMHSMMTPATGKWLKLGVDFDIERDEQARRWLEDAENRLMRAIATSNFHEEAEELYTDLIGFGVSVMYTEEDDDDFFRFSARHIAEVVISEDHKGRVDTLGRFIKMTARQIVGQFGKENLNDAIKKAWDKEPEKTFEVLHAVLPRDDYDDSPGPKSKTRKKYASYWVHMEGDNFKSLLEEGGYDEFPFQVPRWRKTIGEKYGRGQGEIALPHAKYLNKLRETSIKGKQLAVAPPLAAEDDALVTPLDFRPFGITYVRRMEKRPAAIVTGGNPMVADNEMEMERAAIRSIFMTDVILTQDGPERTATEILQRTDERSKMLAANIGRLQTDWLEPLVARCFNIMLRKGKFPPIPDILAERPHNIEIHFVSPLAKQQLMAELNALNQGVGMWLPLMNVAKMNPDDIIDLAEAMRFSFDALGAPFRLVRSQADIEERKAAMQEAMVQQQAPDAMAKMAKAGADAAKAENLTKDTSGPVRAMLEQMGEMGAEEMQ